MSDFTLPTSRHITQPYGAEFDDWDGDGDVDYPGGFYHSIGWDGHNGIDYACGLGDPIEAVADGYVSFAGWAGSHWLLSGGGNAIMVEHRAHGVQTEYLHLSRFAVSAGEWVNKGQVIGYAGKTGAATGYHLHLGMLPLTGININNRMRGRIDPTPYLYGAGLAAQGTITEVQEDDMAQVPQEQWDRVVAVLHSLDQNVVTDKKLATALGDVPRQVWSYQNPELGGGDAYQILRNALASTSNLAVDVARVAAQSASGGASEEQITDAVKDAITKLLLAGAGK